ncbi:MAG: pyridoxal phosphate-dependent aminotransferase [Archaeoglobus sp.]|nr:pyridoxal phosphate-dependent aminotransferase [Archaeoglobus sp.]
MEARRVSEISTSQIRKMFEVVEKAKKSGKDVISLTIGEPDFHTHPEILKRAYEAMKNGYTHYTSNFGIEELREQIAEMHGVEMERVMITAGASEALLNTSLAFIERGSDVLIPIPNFLSYFTYTKLCEARVLGLDTTSTDFVLNPDHLNEQMSKEVSAIFINYPNNPTGAVMDQKTLEAVAEIARDNGAVLISDEVYSSIHYDKKPGTLAGEEGVVTINAFSKSLAMTGWRIGYIIAEESLLDSILKIHQVNGVCAPAFAQKAVADVMAEGIARDITEGMVREFRKRRDYVYKSLREILEVVKPEGAFYIFPKVPMDSIEFTERLLAETGVAITPGIAFGSENHVRISYAASMENLEKAMGRIRLFVEDLG